MITEEHLNHWLAEITYQLKSITQEINATKLNGTKGMEIGNGFVSFEYLREKAETIAGTIRCIESDIKTDLVNVEKIIKELEHRKKHPQAMNYAQFESWVTDILNGGNGFPLPTKKELGLES